MPTVRQTRRLGTRVSSKISLTARWMTSIHRSSDNWFTLVIDRTPCGRIDLAVMMRRFQKNVSWASRSILYLEFHRSSQDR